MRLNIIIAAEPEHLTMINPWLVGTGLRYKFNFLLKMLAQF